MNAANHSLYFAKLLLAQPLTLRPQLFDALTVARAGVVQPPQLALRVEHLVAHPTQVHDNNGGIVASGLFWTVPADERQLKVSRDGRRAVLELRDVAVVDSFQFFGPNQTPASVSLHGGSKSTCAGRSGR